MRHKDTNLLGTPFLRTKQSIARIEEASWGLVTRCVQELGLQQVPLPIPVECWIERPLGYAFGITDLSALGPQALGAASISEREILVSESIRHEGRFRFTCAHELGHMTLHAKHAAAQARQRFVDAASAPPMTAAKSNRIEWEADRFAAAFLMPLPLICNVLVDVCQSQTVVSRGHDVLLRDGVVRAAASYATPTGLLAEAMLDTPESVALWRTVLMPSLTKKFGVSASALVHRFEDIVLPDGKPFLLKAVATQLLGFGSVVRSSHVSGSTRDQPTLTGQDAVQFPSLFTSR